MNEPRRLLGESLTDRKISNLDRELRVARAQVQALTSIQGETPVTSVARSLREQLGGADVTLSVNVPAENVRPTYHALIVWSPVRHEEYSASSLAELVLEVLGAELAKRGAA